MFGTKEQKEVKNNAVEYKFKVTAARATKNDKIVMIDLNINGVAVKSCMLKEITIKKDGDKHKAGDICYVINFPSEKVGDKYYNLVWAPVSNENLEDILNQVKNLLT